MIRRDEIYVYEDGRPIEGRPDDLPEGATGREFAEWVRAWHEYSDRVISVANRAFDEQFRKSLKGSRR